MSVEKLNECLEKSFKIKLKLSKFMVKLTEDKGRSTFKLYYYNDNACAVPVGTFGLAMWDELIANLEEIRDHSEEAQKMEMNPERFEKEQWKE